MAGGHRIRSSISLGLLKARNETTQVIAMMARVSMVAWASSGTADRPSWRCPRGLSTAPATTATSRRIMRAFIRPLPTDPHDTDPLPASGRLCRRLWRWQPSRRGDRRARLERGADAALRALDRAGGNHLPAAAVDAAGKLPR